MSIAARRAFSSLALSILVCAGAAGHARADIISYNVILDGPSEPTASPGTGVGTVDYNNVTHMLTLHVSFTGLIGPTTASHIHAATAAPFTGTAGVATTTPTFLGFPLGVTSGVWDAILDLTLASSYNPSYVTAHGGNTAQAEADLTAAFAAGTAYWNIHTSQFPGGEIRGFLRPVPTPGAAALLGLGGLIAVRRKR